MSILQIKTYFTNKINIVVFNQYSVVINLSLLFSNKLLFDP